MNLFNKALIFFCVFVIAFLRPSYGQEAEWMIEPFIGKTKDLIAIYENDRIIHFTRDGKEGVVNFKNEVILPAKYDKITIYKTKKYINAKIDREVFHYDFEGYELDEEMEQEAREAEWTTTNMLNAQKANAFNQENKNFNLVEVGIQPKDYKPQLMGYALTTSAGDTLIDRVEVLDNFLLFGKEHIVHQGKGVHLTCIFNASGDTIFQEKPYLAKAKIKNGWNIVEMKETDAVYDDQMNLITDKYDNIYPLKCGNSFIYREGRNRFLLDGKGQPVDDVAYSKIQQIGDSEFLTLQQGELISIYDTKNSKFIELVYPISKVQNKTLCQISMLDEKFGIINVQENELKVMHEFEEMKFKKGNFLASNLVSKVDEEELRAYKIFNEMGELIHEVNAFKIYQYDHYILVAKDEHEKSYLLGKDGQIVYTPAKGELLKYSKFDEWVAIEKKGKTAYYLFGNITNENRQAYLIGGKKLKGSDDGEFPDLYVAGTLYKKQMGALDAEGNVIIPMAYPEIEIKKLCGQRYLTSRSRPYGPIGIIRKWH